MNRLAFARHPFRTASRRGFFSVSRSLPQTRFRLMESDWDQVVETSDNSGQVDVILRFREAFRELFHPAARCSAVSSRMLLPSEDRWEAVVYCGLALVGTAAVIIAFGRFVGYPS
jgi:hypothetical protein